jgi:hypothetical protein
VQGATPPQAAPDSPRQLELGAEPPQDDPAEGPGSRSERQDSHDGQAPPWLEAALAAFERVGGSAATYDRRWDARFEAALRDADEVQGWAGAGVVTLLSLIETYPVRRAMGEVGPLPHSLAWWAPALEAVVALDRRSRDRDFFLDASERSEVRAERARKKLGRRIAAARRRAAKWGYLPELESELEREVERRGRGGWCRILLAEWRAAQRCADAGHILFPDELDGRLLSDGNLIAGEQGLAGRRPRGGQRPSRDAERARAAERQRWRREQRGGGRA